MNNNFLEKLERLVTASKDGDFNVRLDNSGLSREETKTVNILNKIIENYQAASKRALQELELSVTDEMRQTLSRRSELLNALDEMDVTLLTKKHGSFDEALNACLAPIAETANLDRIVVYSLLSGGSIARFGQKYRWDKAEGGLISLDGELVTIPPHPAITNWINILSGGGVINICTGTMSPDELSFLSAYGVKSILLIPVITNGILWGSVTFQDHVRERLFDSESIGFLRSAARLCAGAIIGNEKTLSEKRAVFALSQREKMMRALNETAVQFLSCTNLEFEEMMTAGINPLADAVDLDRISVWENFETPQGLHTGQVYRWDRESGGTTIPTAGLEDFDCVRAAPYWLEAFLKGESINCPVSEMPKDSPETKLLEHFNVKAAFVTPVFIDDKFWGFVLFEDRVRERHFDDDSADIMRSAAFLCASAVNRRETETDIVEKNELIRIMFENAPVGLTLFDENFKFVDCNNEILKILGGVSKEFYRKFFGSEKHSPEFQPDGRKSYDKAMEVVGRVIAGESMTIEWLHCTPDGAPLPVELTMTRIKRGDKYIGLGYIYDMREQIRLKEEIESALVKTQEASKAKSAFLANMSHEIRTPINAIIGMVTIGKSADDALRKDYCLTKIQDASKHLLGVINDILDISKIEANKFELSFAEFDFEKLLQNVVNVMSFRIDERKQKLEVNFDENIPHTLVGDDQRITQVITNLLSNAIKFTPEDGMICLQADLIGEDDDICTIQVSVKDTGIGISEEHRKNLFRSFQQADNNTARKFGGTGLGLAICKSIVEMMGGTIWAESVEGKGSTFTFTMTAVRGSSPQKNDDGDGIGDVTGVFAGHRILLAEDTEVNCEILKALLEPTNLQIDVAVNGREAVGMFRENPDAYSLIFMDIQMPEMDGLEATQIIRAMDNVPKAQTIPIIAMTANVFKEDVEKCIESGMNGHIGKPINMDEVVIQLNKYLRSVRKTEKKEI